MPEFDGGRIVDYKIENVDYLSVILPVALININMKSIDCCHTEQHTGFQQPIKTNVQEDRHILLSALQNQIIVSWTVSQEIGMFAELSVSVRTVCRCLQQYGRAGRWPLLQLCMIIQHKERQFALKRRMIKLDTGIATCRLFRRILVIYDGNILMAVCVSGGYVETARHLTAFEIDIWALYLVQGVGTPLVNDTYISSLD